MPEVMVGKFSNVENPIVHKKHCKDNKIFSMLFYTLTTLWTF